MELHQSNEHKLHLPWHGSSSSCATDERGKSTDNVYQIGFQSKDPIITVVDADKLPKNKKDSFEGKHGHHGASVEHPTSFLETLMHLLKGNIGSGIFAMGDAVKNAGIIMGPCIVLMLGVICVHCQHMLLNVSIEMDSKSKVPIVPDYAETVELVFSTGSLRMKKFATFMKRLVNVFLCVTQLGFCCVYFVFISENVKQVFDYYGYSLDIHFHMAIILLPILLTCLIRNLKYLAPSSTIANVFMCVGIVITLYFSTQDLPPFSDRPYIANLNQLPLFFGTAVFAFEGIGLVLPLQNEMKNPETFRRPFGVLNVGMSLVISLYLLIGVLGYLKYGSDVQGSVTLNIPQTLVLGQAVKIIISVGILLTYSLQFYIPIDIMWPTIYKYMGESKYPVFAEMVFRTIFVLLTFVLAEAIPFLHLFISLVGAVSSAALALLFPPILEIVTSHNRGDLNFIICAKNVIILLIGVVGAVTGTYESINAIIHAFYYE